MQLIVCFVLGFVAGALCLLPVLMIRERSLKARAHTLESQANGVRELRERVLAKQKELEQAARSLQERSVAKQQELASREQEVQAQLANLESHRAESARSLAELERQRADFQAGVITYDALQRENTLLKKDLLNIHVQDQKLRLDQDFLSERQQQLDEKAEALARQYLRDTVKAVTASINASNFAACKDRLLDVINHCREIGYSITVEEEAKYVADLKANFERAVKAALEREEQARIKAQIREEEKIRREIEQQIEQANREKIAIQAALDRAMAEARDRHSEEVDLLKAKLAEAEAKSQRALSMAQQTKAGNVYVISNIGSFGKGVYKVGMTRRQEPKDRIKELGDASVPFPFDVHMMIACKDAPTLENALHRALHKMRINRINPRKEFFKVELEQIIEVVKANHGEVEYVADPEALEYNQSLSITEEDADYVESVYDAADKDDKVAVED